MKEKKNSLRIYSSNNFPIYYKANLTFCFHLLLGNLAFLCCVSYREHLLLKLYLRAP